MTTLSRKNKDDIYWGMTTWLLQKIWYGIHCDIFNAVYDNGITESLVNELHQQMDRDNDTMFLIDNTIQDRLNKCYDYPNI